MGRYFSNIFPFIQNLNGKNMMMALNNTLQRIFDSFSDIFFLQFFIVVSATFFLLALYSFLLHKLISQKSFAFLLYISGAAFFAAYYLELFLEKCDNFSKNTSSGILSHDLNLLIIMRLLLLITVAYIGFIIIALFGKRIIKYIIKNRYMIAMIILIAAVTFEISGSSIGFWNKYIGDGESDDGILTGIPREIRSDEWAVSTPFKFSQYYNHNGEYPFFSETLRGMKTDTGIVGGLPSWNIITIFRPFEWGFLFLGNAKGLSFFWFSRLLALILVSFELALLFTNKNNLLSILFSIIVTFSPAIQWWYSTPIVEILIFGQLALLIFNKYFREKIFYKKILYSLILIMCIGGYAAVLYPAWQIPLFYVFLALFFGLIKTNYKVFSFCAKQDLILIFFGILVFAACSIMLYTQSAETIRLVMNTVYPGKRVMFGGGEVTGLFNYASNILFPITDSNLSQNVCEMSSFFTFFPFAILLSLYLIFLIKGRKDFLLIALLSVEVFLICYVCFPFPKIVAQILFLSHSTASRAIIGVGFADSLLLIRGLSVFFEKKNKQDSLPTKPSIHFLSLLITIILSVIVFTICSTGTGQYLKGVKGAIVFSIVLIGFFFCTRIYKKNGFFSLTMYFSLLLILSGSIINPIQKGTDVIYKNPVTIQIKQITDQDNGLWLVSDSSWIYGNLPIMAGAPTINSTNMYPSIERWWIIDRNHQFEATYNRYAHISVELTNNETEFILLYSDNFKLLLNFMDIPKLNVRFLLTNSHYEGTISGVTFIELYHDTKFNIYELSYSK